MQAASYSPLPPSNILHGAPTNATAAGDGGPIEGRRGAARHSAPHGSETQQLGGLSQLECCQGRTLPHLTQADLDDVLLKVILMPCTTSPCPRAKRKISGADVLMVSS